MSFWKLNSEINVTYCFFNFCSYLIKGFFAIIAKIVG